MSMDEVLVSVIIPTFNREEKIKNAIKSILDQKVASLEIIVVDDKSTDDTSNCIRELQKSNNSIKYLYNNGCRGPSCTRNVGILASSGKYIAFLDSDDVWLDDHLKPAIELLEKSNNGYVIFGNALNKNVETGESTNHFDDKVTFMNAHKVHFEKDFYLLDEPLFLSLIQESYLLLPSMILKTEIMKSLLLNEKVVYSEDRDLGIRLEKEERVKFIVREKPTYIRYISDDNLCAQSNVNSIKMYNDHVSLFLTYLQKYQLDKNESRILQSELFLRRSELSNFYRYEKKYIKSMGSALKMLGSRRDVKAIKSVFILLAKSPVKAILDIF